MGGDEYSRVVWAAEDCSGDFVEESPFGEEGRGDGAGPGGFEHLGPVLSFCEAGPDGLAVFGVGWRKNLKFCGGSGGEAFGVVDLGVIIGALDEAGGDHGGDQGGEEGHVFSIGLSWASAPACVPGAGIGARDRTPGRAG